MSDDNRSFRADLTTPLPSYNAKEKFFKTGYSVSQSERTYDSRAFDVRARGSPPFVSTGNPADYLAQKLGKHWKAKLSAKNLLDPVSEVTQDWPAANLPIKSYTRGMTFGLSVSCEF